jgi:RHS repeat-associated protein
MLETRNLQMDPYDTNVSYVVDGDNQVQTANNVAWIYDANGNVLNDGTNTYQWVAENRPTFITSKSSGHISQFKYDGFSRRTVIIEKANATATPVETHYLWCGSAPCESHTATGQQLALYFRQGEIATGSNAPNYYARDSLGSVMQVVDANGALLGGAQYTDYGKVVLASGVVPTFGYAGMFQHAPSLTNFTLYRVYSPTSERWLSRDPIGELGGRNLYAYVGGNPATKLDPFGLLCPPPIAGPDPYPALNDDSFFNVKAVPSDFFAAAASPPTQVPDNLFATFVYSGMAGGAATGTGIGLYAASYAAPAAAAEMAGTSGTLILGPLAGFDAVAGLTMVGLATGAAAGTVMSIGAYALYMMSQVPPPPNGSYGPPYGNFSPY